MPRSAVYFFSSCWVATQHHTHWKSVGFSCDSGLEHLSEVLFPETTPKLHRMRLWVRSLPLGRVQGWALGTVEQSLFNLCTADKISEGHWGQSGAILTVCIVWSRHRWRWPSASSRRHRKADVSLSCSHFAWLWKAKWKCPSMQWSVDLNFHYTAALHILPVTDSFS